MRWTAGRCRACGKITGPWPGMLTFWLAKLHEHKGQAMWNAVVTDKGRRACRAALLHSDS